MVKLFVFFGIIVIGSAGAYMFAEQEQQSKENEVVSVEYIHDELSANNKSGRMAYIDPTTGKLTSTPADPLITSAAVTAQAGLPPVKITSYANGMVMAELNGRFRTPLVATIDCDGRLEVEHSNDTSSKKHECEAQK